ncbi:hypothetical protein O181_006211 [Austropuccinia psidii MF-1]|uniref:Uncharacterized protein n=1 Tax=Austropuccinia psidii MF-1 TaxID=1389203 RepID=A0A9Q3GGK0_9BASI|nr:hypothetical protein [Austropuccinia psidii MF-1]
MVKKLRWFIIPLAINPVLPILILLPKDSKVTLFPALLQLFNQLFLQLHQALPPPGLPFCRSKTISHPSVQKFPIVTSQQLQPVASSSRRREEISLPFPPTQVFQQKEHWPIKVTGQDPNTASENQDAVARLFRRIDRNIRELIEYANDRTICGAASEEMASKSSWYKDELINDFQRTFDHLGGDN